MTTQTPSNTVATLTAVTAPNPLGPTVFASGGEVVPMRRRRGSDPTGRWPPGSTGPSTRCRSGPPPAVRTMLGVWAHPDDEAYLSAGLMAEFRRRGGRVVVVTATAGEHGTSDPVAWPPNRLAALRRIELRESLAAVGVDELHLLGYEDGTCDRQDDAAVTKLIACHIAAVQPDLIVTFGPDGVSGHPDHLAVNRWTTDAWARTRPSAELWYPTFTPSSIAPGAS